MRGNIPKLYIANLLTGLVFWYSVEKLFMYRIGISPFGVSVNAVLLVIVTSLFDVPFGVLADRWNRKYTLALGICSLGLSSLILGASHGLSMYLIGTIFYGLYICLTSGTFQAITYDSLQEAGKANLYAKHQGGSYGLFMVGIALASPIGGFLAHSFNYPSTYYLSAAVCVLNLGVILSMHEPKFHKAADGTRFLHHIRHTTHLLLSTKTLLYLSSLLLVVGMLRSSLNEYAGLYFIAIGFGAIGSGWANGGKWLFGSIGQFISGKFVRFLLVAIAVFFLAFVVMSSWRTPLGLIFFYLCTFTHGVIQNETQAMLQTNLSSELRATALSLVNFGTSSLMIPLGLGFGWLAEHANVFVAYQLFAFMGLLYFLAWLFWRKVVLVRPVAEPAMQPAELT